MIVVDELAALPSDCNLYAISHPQPVNINNAFETGYRPISTLGHYSAVGAFATVNYMLALTLSTMRHPGFPKLWLSLVMAVNRAGLVASLTRAPLNALPLVTSLQLGDGRPVPRTS